MWVICKMALPKFKWTEQTPGLANNWSKMWNKVTIQKPRGTIDAAGATPPDWVDCVVGHDGNGVYAEIQEPSPEDAILALEQGVRITHKIKIRYDGRIKEDMQATWIKEGTVHHARIHTIADPNYEHHWMILDAVEQTNQAEAYR
jgi:SPP1 family predicted phage head-tail adaptor